MYLLTSVCLLGEVFIQIPIPILTEYFLPLSYMSSLYILLLALYDMVLRLLFFPFCRWPFHFVDGFPLLCRSFLYAPTVLVF